MHMEQYMRISQVKSRLVFGVANEILNNCCMTIVLNDCQTVFTAHFKHFFFFYLVLVFSLLLFCLSWLANIYVRHVVNFFHIPCMLATYFVWCTVNRLQRRKRLTITLFAHRHCVDFCFHKSQSISSQLIRSNAFSVL